MEVIIFFVSFLQVGQFSEMLALTMDQDTKTTRKSLSTFEEYEYDYI